MMTTINEALVALSRWVELSILGKATIMLLIGLAVVKLAGRARASVRHLLLTATLATVLALPLIALTAPEVTLTVPVTRAVEPIRNVVAAAPSSVPSTAAITSLPPQPTQRSFWSEISLIAIVRLAWLAGSFLLLLHLAVSLRRLNLIRRNGLPWTERSELIRSLTAECGIHRPIEVLLHERILTPLTYGFLRPAVILPSEAIDWNEGDLRRAIIHELEHVRRGDWIIQLASRVTCALYWFHPLVWVAFRWLNLQAERACDDAVVRSAERTEYAEQLVLLAGRLSKAHAQPALGMANRSDLSTRVSALLDGSQRRGRAGFMAAASALSVAGLVVLVIAPVRAVTLSGRLSAQALVSQNKISQKRISTALDRALLEAAEEGDIGDIGELISAGANVNCKFDGDGSPLIVAAREGRLDAVRLLLDRGADPNIAAHGDGNPLIMAAGEGHADVVSLLLDRGASIDQIVPGDENALIRASGRGHLNVVKLLVARGADVNARAPVDGEAHFKWDDQGTLTDMKSGKELTDSEIRDRLVLKRKLFATVVLADDDKTEGHWRTPLGQARSGGHDEIVAFLLASGARE